MNCWFAGTLSDAGPCDGQLVACHLIPRSLMRREFPNGAYSINGELPFRATPRDPSDLRASGAELRSLTFILTDRGAVVPGCGGAMGVSGHHGRLDVARTLRVSRALLPAAVEKFATEYGLLWWLDRTYGQLERSAA